MIKSINVNPDIKSPPLDVEGEAIVISRPKAGFEDSPLIDKWADAPIEGTYVLGSIDGIIQWIATEDCDAV